MEIFHTLVAFTHREQFFVPIGLEDEWAQSLFRHTAGDPYHN